MSDDAEYDAAEAEYRSQAEGALHHALDALGPRECLRIIADQVERKAASKVSAGPGEEPF